MLELTRVLLTLQEDTSGNRTCLPSATECYGVLQSATEHSVDMFYFLMFVAFTMISDVLTLIRPDFKKKVCVRTLVLCNALNPTPN